MADQDQTRSLDGLTALMAQAQAGLTPERALPPVERWNPPDCGDIGMEIRADGTWWHEGSIIARPALVRLFSTILRRDEDGSDWLVTPHERVSIRVEDCHFIAVNMAVKGAQKPHEMALVFTTQLGDVTEAGPDRPIRVLTDPATGEPRPYVRVRGRLEARMTRAVFFELAEWAVENPADRGRTLGVWSGGAFFVLGENPAAEGV